MNSSTSDTPPPQPTALTLNGHDILFPSLPYDMAARAEFATSNPQLQRFMQTGTVSKDANRKRVCAEVFGDNYDAIRTLAGSIKQHTLDHLDYYIETFIKQAAVVGAQVHFAIDGAQANAVCVDIAKHNNCKLCVKSKSMVTEETHLLPALEDVGCQVVETDLGEFIIQLDHDAPSHIVAPMMHKDRTAVGRAFERELGVPYTDDPQQLTQIANRYLRDKYRRADLGISGGNFLVAETGSLVICTNEGNGRLCTSVPPIHVAFVGIEKLIPSFEHLSVFLKLLSRSGTGQPLTVYNHVMTGPRRDHEPDGPQQMHIILVDNGRSEVLKPQTREMLRCIRCGACLNACPVYRQIGGHAYGAVYSGPIGALITPLFQGLGNYSDLPHASSLCGACYEACPVNINIPKYLVQLRRDMVDQGITKLSQRLLYRLWSFSLRHRSTYRLGSFIQKFLFRLMARSSRTQNQIDLYVSHRWLRDVPGPLKGWTSQRDMPVPPVRDFRHWWRQHQRGHES